MNILIISGSPRKKGNTAKINNLLSDIAAHRKHHIEICNVTDYQINGCLGCNTCQQTLNDTGCVQRDDAKSLLDKIIRCDAVIYSTPLYGHSFSGQLKTFLDRHVALFKFVGGMDKSVDEMQIISFVKDKPAVLIVSCMGPEQNNTELIKAQFTKFCESSLMSPTGTYIFPFCSHDAKETTIPESTLTEITEHLEKCITI